MVRAIAEAHGGEVTVQSSSEAGTCFSVRFALNRQPDSGTSREFGKSGLIILAQQVAREEPRRTRRHVDKTCPRIEREATDRRPGKACHDGTVCARSARLIESEDRCTKISGVAYHPPRLEGEHTGQHRNDPPRSGQRRQPQRAGEGESQRYHPEHRGDRAIPRRRREAKLD